jgi:hypothetical protein
MGLHADGVDDRIGTGRAEGVAHRGSDLRLVVAERGQVEHVGAVEPGSFEPFRHQVDPDDLRRAEVGRDAAGHGTDGSEAEHHDRAAGGDGGVLHRLPRGRQDVGEVHESIVGGALGDLDRAVVRLGHAQQLGLAPGTWPYSLV